MAGNITSPVEAHYTRSHLFDSIMAALEKAGIARGNITRKDLAGIDEFHVRGKEVSQELASALPLQPGWRILDVGCGLGGPCRMFADEYGCLATGIDITAEYVETATRLSEITGLDKRTIFVHADALQLPFPDESFDVVWTQHAQMNIADKQQLYSEISRVLVPGGHFIYYDIFSRDHQELLFPLPWAAEPSISHLITTEEMHTLLQKMGLKQVIATDQTEKGISFFESVFERVKEQGLPAVGLHILMGASGPEKLRNLLRNLVEGKVVLESGVYLRQSK